MLYSSNHAYLWHNSTHTMSGGRVCCLCGRRHIRFGFSLLCLSFLNLSLKIHGYDNNLLWVVMCNVWSVCCTCYEQIYLLDQLRWVMDSVGHPRGLLTILCDANFARTLYVAPGIESVVQILGPWSVAIRSSNSTNYCSWGSDKGKGKFIARVRTSYKKHDYRKT